MRKELLVFFCFLASQTLALEPPPRVKPIWGYDVLGVAKYCDTYLQAPQLPAVSSVMGVFGDPWPCILKKITTQNTTDVQIDLVDATCWRNKVCPAGTPLLNDMRVMRERALIVNHYAEYFPKINFWVSPYLEHDIKNPAELQKAFDVIKTACPTCKLINSPVSGVSIAGIPKEQHGTTASDFSISGDGQSSFDGDNIKDDGNNFQHRQAGSETTFGWINSFNLRCTGEHSFVPISQRTIRPTGDEFLQLHKILTTQEDPRPNPPAACKNIREVQSNKGEILKSNAELYCNGTNDDGRGNKPLLIITKKGNWAERMPIFNSAGKEVGCFRYYGTYSKPNLYRWYVGSCSGQTPWKLYQSLGNEWGFAKDSKGDCIRFNSIRRQGVYR